MRVRANDGHALFDFTRRAKVGRDRRARREPFLSEIRRHARRSRPAGDDSTRKGWVQNHSLPTQWRRR